MNNEINNNEISTEKATALLSGRVMPSRKEWLDEYKRIHGLKTFDEVMENIINIVSNVKIDESKQRLDFKSDMEAISKAMNVISGVVQSIENKANQEIDSTIREANNKLEQKDAVLLEAESAMKEIEENGKVKFDEFKKEIELLENELADVRAELIAAEKSILSLDESNKEKDITISQLNTEKAKLNAEVTEHIELSREQQSKINSLLALEEENVRLRKELEQSKEINRDLKSDLSIKENIIDSKSNENNNLVAEINSLRESLEEKKNQITMLNEEFRTEIASMTIEHKEEILLIKEKIKEDFEKNYDDKITKLKDEIYDLKKEISSFEK